MAIVRQTVAHFLTILVIICVISKFNVIKCDTNTNGDSVQSHQLLKLFTGGVPSLIWENILYSTIPSVTNQPISKSCSNSLNTIRNQFKNGQTFALQCE